MRITNSMISNSSRSHIASAKNKLLTAENQYTTQKRILRPSDDPTIAVRSLQLRTTYSQVQQYLARNVQDGMSWMDSTETALTNMDSILTNMLEQLNRGANDDLGVDERTAVLSVLREYAKAIFEDEANTDFAGRYVFTGYRTDTSLLFPEDVTNLEYEIIQNLTSADIDTITYVYGGTEYAAGKDADDYAKEVPVESKAYRMKLAYDNCSNTAMTGSTNPAIDITLSSASGKLNVKTMSSADADNFEDALNDPNDPNGPYDAIYLYDTGEIIFSSNIYKEIQENAADIQVTYNKKEFEKGDIRPEMYFECTSYNTDSAKSTYYKEPSNQEIQYEVNFSQLSTVNVQARDAVSTEIYRAIDYLERTIREVEAVELKIRDAENMIANTTDEKELADYNKLKETLELEKRLRVGVMTEAFGKGITMVSNSKDKLNVAFADLGSRYNRLQLTADKLEDQSIDTEEKLSNNEDMDLADVYINLSEADYLYQSALTATSRILGNSLLNYI